jgi:transcriptional regulator with GAF, ATPase, and Fis domain
MTAPDRFQRLYQAVAQHDGQPGAFNRLKAICHACVDVLPVTGAGVMLMAARVHQGTLYATDARIQQLEELQNAGAEGPCIDAYVLGRPVLAPDLSAEWTTVWPLLAAGAMKAGIHALFSFPLQLDNASVGALDLFRDRPGPLTAEQVDDARLLAAMATREVLTMQAEAAAGSLPDQIADLSGDRAAIEQATGMVAAQTGQNITEAARLLREAAVAADRALADMARDVVSRVLRLG